VGHLEYQVRDALASPSTARSRAHSVSDMMRFAVILAIVSGALTIVGLILVGLVWLAFIVAAAGGALALAAIRVREVDPRPSHAPGPVRTRA